MNAPRFVRLGSRRFSTLGWAALAAALVVVFVGPAAMAAVSGFVVPRDAAPRFSGPAGREADTTTVVMTAEQTGGSIGVIRQVVPPKGGPPAHIHKAEDEFFHIVSGEFKFRLGDRTVEASGGSFVFVPRGEVHTFRNVGTAPGVLVVAITPGGFEKFFADRQGMDARGSGPSRRSTAWTSSDRPSSDPDGIGEASVMRIAPSDRRKLIVQKYGGSSVADAEKIEHVARRVLEVAAQGHGVVVVVSAMGKTTDDLVAMARRVAPTPSPRELDMLLATGEQAACALLAMALHALGQPACALTGGQVAIHTDGAHGHARIRKIGDERIGRALRSGEVAVVAGFQGISLDQDITTLGRGGSDLTAVALAAALEADVCEIYTDVEGVYTADPHTVPDARKLGCISYDEMLELASLGAKVLQARSVELAKKYGVPVHVRSSFTADPGTLVVQEVPPMEDLLVVTGVACDCSHAKLSLLEVPDRRADAARIFGAVAAENIVVDMIVQNDRHDGGLDISFTLPRSDRPRAVQVLDDIAREVGAALRFDDRVAKVSIVGGGLRCYAGVAACMFATLARAGIGIQMISTSEIAVSCVIDENHGELAVRALHEAFGLAKGAGRPAAAATELAEAWSRTTEPRRSR